MTANYPASMGGSEVVFLAGGPPTATDDATTCGAREGNRWHDQTADAWYFCSSAAPGAAVWQHLTSGTGGGITDAPSDGKTYGRLNAAWHQALPIEGGILTGSLTVASGGMTVALATSGAQIPAPVVLQTTYGAGTPYVPATKVNFTLLEVVNNGNNAAISLDAFGGSTFVNGRSSEALAPAGGSTAINRILFGMRGFGYSPAGFSSAARAVINLAAAENYTDTAQGSYIAFQTAPIGSVAAAVEVARVSAAGAVLIGTTADAGYLLDVNGSARVSGPTTITSATDANLYLTSTGSSWPGVKWNNASGGAGAAGFFQSQRGGLNRWSVEFGGSEAESGGNAGTNFLINRFDDTGNVLSPAPLKIWRSTGSMTIGAGATFGSVLAGSTVDLSKHIALFSTTWGIGMTSGAMNFVANGAVAMQIGANVALLGAPTAPTATAGTSTTQIASTAFVGAAVSTAVAASVTSFNTRVGAVILAAADVTGVGGALLASPAFSGSPTAPTPGTADNSTNIATTGFVKSLGYSTTLGTVTSIVAGTGLSGGTITAAGTIAIASGGVTNALRANMAANTLSGNNTALAAPPIDLTVAQAQALLAVPAASATTPIMDSVAAIGTLTSYARGDHVHPTDTSRFAVAGGAITGAVTLSAAGTALTVTNNTSLGGATTVGSNTATNTSALTINGAAGYYRRLMFQTAGVERWRLHTNFTAESGGNAGSDFVIERYDDTGTYIGQSLGITRSTGQIAAFGPLSVSGFFTCTGYNISGGALPASAGPGTGIGWNLSNGQRETDFLNLGTLATASFNFYQYTAATTTQLLASMTPSTLTLNIGESFGSVLAGSATDLSKHIALFSTTFGFSVTTNRQNYVVSSTAAHVFVNGTTDILSVGTAAITANVALNHTAGGTITGSTLAGTTTNTGTINLATATATTPGTADNSTNVATTAYVQSAISPAFNDVGSNKLHNSLFRVQQRGAGPWTANGNYTADRWGLFLSLDTASVSVVAATDTDRAQIGDESVDYFLQNVVTGNAGAAASTQIVQRIEFVRRLSNKTVGVSFWAKAASGTPKLGVSIDQLFGTGGSPSTVVLGNGQAVTLSTTWTRFSLTFTIASTAGKTLGTTLGTDYTQVSFWYSSGTTSATRAGNIGVQSGTISLWGVQLEIGPVTPLERPDPRHDLSNCQRFYNTFAAYVPALASPDNIVLPTTMRATPTVAGGGAGFAVTNGSAALITVAQTAAANQTLTLTADL